MASTTDTRTTWTLVLSGGFDGSIHPTYSVFIRKSIKGGIDGPWNESTKLWPNGSDIKQELGDYLDDHGFAPAPNAAWDVLPTVNGTLSAELRIEPVR